MKISLLMTAILWNRSFIIKTWSRYFVDFAGSKFMLFDLNSSHVVSDYFSREQSIFEFIKLCCDIDAFCCIRFFTINMFYEKQFWLYSNKLINYFSFRHVFHYTNNFFISLFKKLRIFSKFTKFKQSKISS